MLQKYWCLYHPSESITNFCAETTCLMPLCPSCIGEHSLFHQQHRSAPAYQNIHETILEVQTAILDNIITVEEDRKRNNDLIFRIERVPDLLHEKILVAKKLMIEAVEEAFLSLEKRLASCLQSTHFDFDLFSIDASFKLEKQLFTALDDLVELSQGLKGDECLSNLIYYLKDLHPKIHDIHIKAERYLNSNQKYSPIIEINQDVVKDIIKTVEKCMRVDTGHNHSLRQPNGRQNSAYHPFSPLKRQQPSMNNHLRPSRSTFNRNDSPYLNGSPVRIPTGPPEEYFSPTRAHREKLQNLSRNISTLRRQIG